ncbi:HyaD/HybD family hydrogenase maturation endopeptidase [Desulfogranum mediterraneum]|uniref:HyaD/HybD family hydrogenase maturation endopeptidase n=1 Tax=Desulfogranum mediterraneum TaxID=160661 RepID=UPI0005565C51|nr:HyaD/HybD family hydrogenase maturation endopeptidase [Desulfogranum mediterraneum]
MSTQPEQTIGILGIGNILLNDEGFGVHCVQQLEAAYQTPEQLLIFDGGTAGILLAPFIEECDQLIVIDVVNLDDEPGAVHCFTDREVRAGEIQTRMSPHQIGMLEILDICRIRGKVPEKVEFITVVPQDLETGMELSPLLQDRLRTVIGMVRERLSRAGLQLRPKPEHADSSQGHAAA